MYSNSSITQHASLIDGANKPTTYNSLHLLLDYGKRTNPQNDHTHANADTARRHSYRADLTTPEGADLYK